MYYSMVETTVTFSLMKTFQKVNNNNNIKCFTWNDTDILTIIIITISHEITRMKIYKITKNKGKKHKSNKVCMLQHNKVNK